MTLVQSRLTVTMIGMALFGGVALAQEVAPARPAVVKAAPRQPASATVTRGSKTPAKSVINGKAVDNNFTPLPDVTVRLRNLLNNKVEDETTANKMGEFSFVAQPGVPYVVEIADQAGRVVAVSDVITTQLGEVAGTVVAIPTRLPSIAGVFGDTASSVISAAAGTGLTAISAAPPVSPNK